MGLNCLYATSFSVLLLANRRCCSSLSTSGREFSMESILESKSLGSSNYLADRVSSPERYASALNLTVQEVAERKHQYKEASETLHQQLTSSSGMTLTGVDKHTLLCRHRFRYGQHPFVCPSCWSYTPVCICDVIARRTNQLPAILLPSPRLDVVVWVHHSEWGLTSNTGSLLSLTLGNDRCRLFMKGLPEHDYQLREDYLDKHPEDCLLVVLWPDDQAQRGTKRTPKERTVDKEQEVVHEASADDRVSVANARIGTSTISLDDLQLELAKPDGRRVVLIAVDGTWGNARRMVSRLPRSIPRLDLPANVLKENLQSAVSLLASIRSKGSSKRQRRHGQGDTLVCTAEAVVSILMALGMKTEDGQFILDIARTKVELVRRYRGHESKILKYEPLA